MFCEKGMALVAACLLLLVSGAGVVNAQLFGGLRIRPDEYNVKILNDSGQWLRVRMIGTQEDASLRVGLRHRSWWRADLLAGQRVLVAWDQDGKLVLIAPVTVDRSGTLRIPEFAMQMGGASMDRDAGGRHKDASSGFPSLSIEEEAPMP